MFFQNFLTAAQQVVILYLIAAVGFGADRLKIYTEKTARACNDLLFYIITPCVIIKAFMTTEFTAESAKGFFMAALCCAMTFAVAILISVPFFRDKTNEDNAVYKYASIYGNMGYMALPLANAVLGAEGVFYCSAGIITFQLFCFTHGVWLMRKKEENEKLQIRRMLLNPGVIGVTLGLPFFLLQLKAPEILTSPISFIGSMNTPLAMLMFGTYMSNADIRHIFSNKQQYLAALLKDVAVPVIMFGILRLTGLVSGALLTSCIIQSSAPSANNTVMFAAKYGRDTAVASKTVTFVSFVSILTMPAMIALCSI
ncbi:MAG: AEC family transporter [Clostridia bacterium]|nr:AEC family transporter [Clostridia bacterium]